MSSEELEVYFLENQEEDIEKLKEKILEDTKKFEGKVDFVSCVVRPEDDYHILKIYMYKSVHTKIGKLPLRTMSVRILKYGIKFEKHLSGSKILDLAKEVCEDLGKELNARVKKVSILLLR